MTTPLGEAALHFWPAHSSLYVLNTSFMNEKCSFVQSAVGSVSRSWGLGQSSPGCVYTKVDTSRTGPLCQHHWRVMEITKTKSCHMSQKTERHIYTRYLRPEITHRVQLQCVGLGIDSIRLSVALSIEHTYSKGYLTFWVSYFSQCCGKTSH